MTYTFPGVIGIAPEALNGACDLDCQERISACMLAHVNNSGAHISIWLNGPDAAIGWGSSPAYPYQEGAFFGNLIANPWQGYYCLGKDMGSGEVPGRLGTSLSTNVYDERVRVRGEVREQLHHDERRVHAVLAPPAQRAVHRGPQVEPRRDGVA